jgi:NAD-dependent deacetylase
MYYQRHGSVSRVSLKRLWDKGGRAERVTTMVDLAFKKRLNRTVELLEKAEKVTAFTGAGISTESGLSDFRSPGGVWDRYRIVTYQEFISDPGARAEYWKMKHELYRELKAAQPNRAHRALAALEQRGKLNCLITQNIDGLHQEAGNASDRIIELHGTNTRAICLDCGKTWPIGIIHERVGKANFDPRCDACNGLVKPATISFGQAMPETELLRAYACASTCDLLFMIGSSLQVEPAASIPAVAHNEGASLVFINRTETPLDRMATVLFREDIGEVLEAVIKGFPGKGRRGL